MATISQDFNVGSNQIINYDYEDISDGTGIVALKCFGSTDSTGESFKLSKQILNGDPLFILSDALTEAGPSFTLEKTATFALSPFNKAKYVKGTAYIEGTLGFYCPDNPNDECQGYILFTFEHYDGTTATTIGTVQTETLAGNYTKFFTFPFCLEVSMTEKQFVKDDILRLKVEMYGHRSSDGVTCQMYLPINPKNEDIGGTPDWVVADDGHSDLNVYVPFRIEE